MKVRDMKTMLYHLFAKRKVLLKTIIIIGLLSLIILTFLFPAQIATPHIIRKHFNWGGNPIIIGEDLQNSGLNNPDFMYHFKVNNIAFITEINQICKEASLKIYDLYQPSSIGCFSIEHVIITNQTLEDWTVFGINTELYTELVSTLNSSFDNVPILVTNHSITTGLYEFNSSKIGNFSITINHNIQTLDLQEKLPSFNSYINELNKYSDNPINKSRMIFIPHESFQTIFKIDIFLIKGYIEFTTYQEDILYWSLDAPRKLRLFKESLCQEFHAKEQSINYLLLYQSIIYKEGLVESNVLIVNIIYSFIHAIQLIIWGLSGALIFLILIKMQQNNKDKEFQMLLAGKNFLTRISTIVLENILIVTGVSVIAYGLLLPFIKLQALIFNFPFDFYNENIKFALIFFPIALFFSLLIIYLDFELHLRKSLKNGQIDSETYQPFAKIPKYIRYQIFLVFVFLLWLLNRSLQPFLYQIGFLFLLGIISVLLFLVIKGCMWVIIRVVKKIKRKYDKPLSNFVLLLEMWKKPINTRFVLSSFIGTMIIGLCIFSIANAEVQKTTMFFNNDFCAIKTTVSLPNNDTTSIEVFLQNNSLLNEHYTKLVFAQHNPWDNISFVHNNQSIVELPKNFCLLYGINITDYQAFYSSWRTDNWLQNSIQPEKLNCSNAFVSKSFAQLGYELGDSITLVNNQNVSIAGFLDQWIGIVSTGNYVLVLESQIMEKLLLDSNTSSIEYQFRFNSEEKNIEHSVEYLLNHLSDIDVPFAISYVPPDMIEGIELVFIMPIMMTLESLVIFFIAVSIFNNLTDIHSSDEARTLGILFMNTDFKKTLFRVKLFEMLLSITLIAVIVSSILVVFSIILDSNFTSNNVPNFIEIIKAGLGFSKNIVFYSIIILLFYLLIVVVQNVFDYLKFNKLKIHLLFRHIE